MGCYVLFVMLGTEFQSGLIFLLVFKRCCFAFFSFVLFPKGLFSHYSFFLHVIFSIWKTVVSYFGVFGERSVGFGCLIIFGYFNH